jgi:hypothetical protein
LEDLNYLHQRQRVSLIAADASLTSCARVAHRELARAYGRRIDALRAANDAEAIETIF